LHDALPIFGNELLERQADRVPAHLVLAAQFDLCRQPCAGRKTAPVDLLPQLLSQRAICRYFYCSFHTYPPVLGSPALLTKGRDIVSTTMAGGPQTPGHAALRNNRGGCSLSVWACGGDVCHATHMRWVVRIIIIRTNLVNNFRLKPITSKDI